LTVPALTKSQRHHLLEDHPLCRLSELCETLPDPRRRSGQRSTLPSVVTCLVAALLCNGNSTLAGSEWCREQRDL
jgi:hypothetical protein